MAEQVQVEPKNSQKTAANQVIHPDNTLGSSPVPPHIERQIKRGLIKKWFGMGGAKKWMAGEDIGKY